MSQSRSNRASRYHAYLLRFWEEPSKHSKTRIWRFSLESPQTGSRQGYASLEALVKALQTELLSEADDSAGK